MEWFAVNDIELRQFHMAGLLAGGGDAVKPVISDIRERKISYNAEAVEQPLTAVKSEPSNICPQCKNVGTLEQSKSVDGEMQCYLCGWSG